MRVAAIVHDYPSVTETFVAAQITGLRDLDCDVTVFADGADGAAQTSPTDPGSARVIYFGLPFKRLRESVGHTRAGMAAPANSRHDEQKSAARVVVAKLRSRIEGRAFRRQGPFDLIHAHFGPNGVRAVRQRRQASVTGPIVTSFYGYDVSRRWSRGGYAELFAEGESFLVLSNHMKSALTSLGCPADRVEIHPLGVNPEQFPLKAKEADSVFEIISIARLVPKKGIADAIEAVASLAKSRFELRYTIVGDGPLRGDLERRVGAHGLSSKVRFVGSQSHARVAHMLRESDVLLAPSVTAPDGDAEGTPVAILEAQASGIPVVSTLHAGIPEIVEDNVSGFLVPEGDIEGLTAQLRVLQGSPSLRATMGSAGRSIVVGNHDIRVLNARLLQHYHQVQARGLRM